MRRLSLAVLFAVVLATWTIGQEDDDPEKDIARIRTGLITPSPAWVAQEVSFYVELMSATLFSGTPRFDLPEIAGVIVMKVEGSPVLNTERINGETWSIQRHEFRVYAHRQGRITIPPFQVRFSVAPAFGTPPEQQQMMTDEISFEARMPPGAAGVPLLVSTSDLEVVEKWDPSLDQDRALRLQVGDAIRREISMRAADVPGMALPPIIMPAPDGMAVYPSNPEVTDSADRGDLIGRRTDSVTYVCERPGTVIIPEYVITWWDVEAKELHQVNLPPATLTIAPDESTTDPGGESTQAATEPPSGHHPLLWIIGGVMVAGLATWLLREPLLEWNVKRQQRRMQGRLPCMRESARHATPTMLGRLSTR